MKASTLFGLTFALLMGLGVVVAARVTGFLDAKPVVVEEKKTNGVPMLIAARNLFRGTAALEYDAKVRPMTEADHAMYDKYRDKMLAPIPSAVEYRILKTNVPAGVPLLEDMFEPQALPEQLSGNLAPQMRAVNIVIEKHRVAGGLPRKGEYVDVLLTATIHQNGGLSKDTAPMVPFTASAIIARKLKIVAKRDTPYTLNIPNPVDKPMSFILEANPYRAALIEYAKTRGFLTLVLLAPTNLANDREPMVDRDSKEYRDEDKRVNEFVNNEHTITDADLEAHLQPADATVADPAGCGSDAGNDVRPHDDPDVEQRHQRLAQRQLQLRDPGNGATQDSSSLPVQPMSQTAFSFGAVGVPDSPPPTSTTATRKSAQRAAPSIDPTYDCVIRIVGSRKRMKRAVDISGKMPRRGRNGRAGATLSLLLLLALPVFLILAFFGWNVMLLSQQKTAQEIAADCCALAGGQSMVSDKALTGTPTDIATLENMALLVAQNYDGFNPLWPGGMNPAAHLNIVAGDLAFTTLQVPIGADSLTLIDTMTLAGRRTTAHGNPVPILGGGMFASPTVDITVLSKIQLDRRVAGLRPVYDKSIVLAPIAIHASTWVAQVEKGLPLGNLTIQIGSADTSFLQIGTADESDFEFQLSASGGVTPTNLAGLGGQFFIDVFKGLDVPVLSGVNATDLKPALQSLEASGHARIWPLFGTTDGIKTNVTRLVAAKVIAVADITDPMTMAVTGVQITLQPSFLSAPAVITDSGDVDPYLCRMHLVN